MNSLVGSSIGRYSILEHLDQGGMAEVYKAYDTRLDRTVAIKIIRRTAFGEEVLDRLVRRFEREAKALARLDHPNIVKIHDFGDFNGMPYLVMDYIPGGTLKNIPKPVPPAQAAQLILPIAKALGYAHQLGILHRDVKPSNILINAAGEPMLADFGIAKVVEDSEGGQTLTGTGVGIGTPEYMAPEQGLGQNVDQRADIYALGIVFYELVTGRKPFTADTPMAVVLKHVTDPLPRPRSFISGLPKEIERVIQQALAKKPEQRYQDMATFVKELEKITGTAKKPPAIAPVAEQDPGITQDVLVPAQEKPHPKSKPDVIKKRATPVNARSANWLSQRNTRLFFPGLLIAASVGIVLLLAVRAAPGPRPNSLPSGAISGQETTQPAETISPAASFVNPTVTTAPDATQRPTETLSASPTFSPSPTHTLAPSLTPTFVPATATTVSQKGWNFLTAISEQKPVSQITRENIHTITELARLDVQPLNAWFTPDGQYLFVAEARALHQYDGATLQWIKTFSYEEPLINVSPDGTVAGLEMGNHNVKFIDVQNGEERYTLNSFQKTDYFIFSPDSSVFCFLISCHATADGKQVYNVESGHTYSPDGSLLAFTGVIDPQNNTYSTYIKSSTTRKIVRTWTFDQGYINGCTFNTSSSTFAVALGDVIYGNGNDIHGGIPTIYLLSVESGNTLDRIPVTDGTISEMQFLAGDSLLAAANVTEGNILFLDLATKSVAYALDIRRGDPAGYYNGDVSGYNVHFNYSPNGQFFLSWSNGGILQVWGIAE